MKLFVEPLLKKHKKKDFKCGKDMLDNYIHSQASQDVKRKLSVCFVLEDIQTGLIQGYYTLANNSIPLHTIPKKWKNKLPISYTSIPTTLLGRLAVDERFQGKGIGPLLLVDALKRSYEISASIGSFAVVVDPLDEAAEKFYEKFGFIKLPDSKKMFIAMQTLKDLFV
jgi:GNAT superfamily N-acetyltransferase